MFAGSDSGGHAAAILYGLLNSAKLDGLDPLTRDDLLEFISQHREQQQDILAEQQKTVEAVRKIDQGVSRILKKKTY